MLNLGSRFSSFEFDRTKNMGLRLSDRDHFGVGCSKGNIVLVHLNPFFSP